jgi:hypothetical protein
MEKEENIDLEEQSIKKKGFAAQFYQGICFRYDKNFINFLVQTSLAFIVVIFSVVKLSLGVSADERTIYISLMSGVIGYFLPNPKISDILR